MRTARLTDRRIEAQTETMLIARSKAGDERAFGELARRHLPRAFGIAHQILRNADDAHDAVQDALLAALRGLHNFDTTRAFGPWFGCIVARKSFIASKRRWPHAYQPIAEANAAADGTPLEDTQRGELSAHVRAAVSQLSDRQQAVVNMVELQGLSPAEAAATLGISAATVRWHLHEARGVLRVKLQALDPAA